MRLDRVALDAVEPVASDAEGKLRGPTVSLPAAKTHHAFVEEAQLSGQIRAFLAGTLVQSPLELLQIILQVLLRVLPVAMIRQLREQVPVLPYESASVHPCRSAPL